MPETSTDEQELAKALESVANLGQPKESPNPQDLENSPHDNGVQPIVPPDSPIAPPVTPVVNDDQPPVDGTDDSSDSAMPKPSEPPVVDYADENSGSNDQPADVPATPEPQEESNDSVSDAPAQDAGPLNSIKSEAINELRPLVDKLNISPEEKFDTYLLLIRSTDDVNLIAPAHEAAKAIPDEARKAQALLDIIKEIDYLTHQKNNG